MLDNFLKCVYIYVYTHYLNTLIDSQVSYILEYGIYKIFPCSCMMFENENLVNYWFIFIANKCLLTQNHDKVLKKQ